MNFRTRGVVDLSIELKNRKSCNRLWREMHFSPLLKRRFQGIIFELENGGRKKLEKSCSRIFPTSQSSSCAFRGRIFNLQDRGIYVYNLLSRHWLYKLDPLGRTINEHNICHLLLRNAADVDDFYSRQIIHDDALLRFRRFRQNRWIQWDFRHLWSYRSCSRI